MAISILMGIPPEDMAEGFDQEPAELASTLMALSGCHGDDEERADFLKHFGAAVHDWDADQQTTIHDLICGLKAAIEGQY